jgi:putative membrane protein
MLNKKNISIAVIVIFHLVGLIGFSVDELIPLFKILVPFHLLLMTFILLYNHNDFNKSFLLFISIVYVASFLIEGIGTNTGLIFGEYEYLTTLGYKIWNTPLMIGINWLILVYSAGVYIQRIIPSNSASSVFIKSIIGAALLTLIDYFIEPIAIKFDYWAWQNTLVPLQNYVAWFITAFVFMLVFNKLNFNKSKPIAHILLIVQSLFFVLLSVL